MDWGNNACGHCLRHSGLSGRRKPFQQFDDASEHRSWTNPFPQGHSVGAQQQITPGSLYPDIRRGALQHWAFSRVDRKAELGRQIERIPQRLLEPADQLRCPVTLTPEGRRHDVAPCLDPRIGVQQLQRPQLALYLGQAVLPDASHLQRGP